MYPNTNPQAALSMREVGQIPVSVGTSRALEGAYGILPDQEVTPAPITTVNLLMVNLRTLYRNLMGAVHKDVRSSLSPEDVAGALANELQVIESSLIRMANGLVEFKPYYCSYADVQRRFPKAMHKGINTESQRFWFSHEQQTLKQVMAESSWIVIDQYDIDFPQINQATLLLSHYAIDLLQRYHFTKLALVESHTGAIKQPVHWYTKLTNGKELTNIPFDRMTLQLFGDGGNMFSPMPIKLRRFVLAMAEKNQWTSLTTKEYILKCVRDQHDPVLEALILNLYGSGR